MKQPKLLTEAAEADFRRLWTTERSLTAILETMNLKHNLGWTMNTLRSQAVSRGLVRTRQMLAEMLRSQEQKTFERVHKRRLERDGRAIPQDRVALVPRGSHPVEGFSLLGGRIR